MGTLLLGRSEVNLPKVSPKPVADTNRLLEQETLIHGKRNVSSATALGILIQRHIKMPPG
ncbi:hypothetical protein [Sphingomonas xinjiangensis]|uniref:Uncharacterized protein n=1 Tax=Sphingomonas xinjiangensis TaxID=643568 RepID=A0A840YMR2_9SPHN|nr:hypothetical protein [Sphingomonas xinjiangensis]MBB5708881.1 hypothetical protein [Sphingomonas xinjiangensis]